MKRKLIAALLGLTAIALTWSISYRLGVEKGTENGIEIGHEKGFSDGLTKGFNNGIEQGKEEWIKKGTEQGFDDGFEKGIKKGFQNGFEKGKEEGIEEGIKTGFKQGKEEAKTEIPKGYIKLEECIPLQDISCTWINEYDYICVEIGDYGKQLDDPNNATYESILSKIPNVTEEYMNNMVNMSEVIDFEATETGLTIYLEDGNAYYWGE